MKIPHWEETYKDDGAFTFGPEPNRTITEFAHLFDKSIHILDVGCGDGKNALYLAKQGFLNIDAFDCSENAIHKLKRLAQKGGFSINAYMDDVCKFQFRKTYQLMLSFGTLHFVEKDMWHPFLLRAKQNTAPGGVHMIQLFTNQVPPTSDIAPFAVGLASDGELKELYHDWKILQFKSYTFEEEHPGVPRHLHASNKIVVQKNK